MQNSFSYRRSQEEEEEEEEDEKESMRGGGGRSDRESLSVVVPLECFRVAWRGLQLHSSPSPSYHRNCDCLQREEKLRVVRIHSSSVEKFAR